MTTAEVVARRLAAVSRVSSVTGVFVAMVDGLARVNVQGATVDLRCDGWNPPIPGAPVRVETLNGIMRVVGPAQTLSPRGVVTASLDAGVRAEVLVDGELYVLPVMAPYSPVVTDPVIINWQSGHVSGEEAAAPDVGDPGTTPSQGVGFKDLLIQATASGRYDDDAMNWWGGAEVWASNNNDGIWAYGGRHTALAGADISKVEIYLPLIEQAGSCSIGLHPHPSIPGGAPSIGFLLPLPLGGRGGWVQLDTSWGNYLRDNPNAGIGVLSPTGGFTRWRGVGQANTGPGSGALRFTGTR